jgi:putative membrane protein
MDRVLPYCGAAPLPEDWLLRWNLDPVLIGVWGVAACLAAWQAARAGAKPSRFRAWLAGWALVLAAWVSPLCALGVALFSARVAQHMIVMLLAAPLMAWGWPARGNAGGEPRLALAAWLSLTAASWFWHAPAPYRATFESDAVYWAMQTSLLASAVAVWRVLFGPVARIAATSTLALATCLQMSALGALLVFAPTPLFAPHFATTAAFGLSPLEDQQLGALLLWIPGCAVFLLAGLAPVAGLLEAQDAGAERTLS